jgi:hypothetical protein
MNRAVPRYHSLVARTATGASDLEVFRKQSTLRTFLQLLGDIIVDIIIECPLGLIFPSHDIWVITLLF